jgi:ATP-dependent Clp protease adaptor protein ClpS
MSDTATVERTEEASARPEPKKDERPKVQPPYHVVLLDDDDHTYDYVIEMLQKLFGHSKEQAFLMASEVDTTGRVIVDTTTKERAELKRDQIHAYGADWRMPRCKGSMSSVIEPTEG